MCERAERMEEEGRSARVLPAAAGGPNAWESSRRRDENALSRDYQAEGGQLTLALGFITG